MIIVELFGGPGSGKTTGMATIFGALKRWCIPVEMCREFAQDLIFRGQTPLLNHQTLVLAGQYQKYKELEAAGHNLVISDSSMSLCKIYANKQPHYHQVASLAESLEEDFEIIRVFVERTKEFMELGRVHDEAQSKRLDVKIRSLCGPWDLIITGDKEGYISLIGYLRRKLGV